MADMGRKGWKLINKADLTATADARNIEVAEMIYDEHLAELVRED
ncbi:MAG: hypothetical protein R6U38_00735 [Desulfatiglandaceae bacterium]